MCLQCTDRSFQSAEAAEGARGDDDERLVSSIVGSHRLASTTQLSSRLVVVVGGGVEAVMAQVSERARAAGVLDQLVSSSSRTPGLAGSPALLHLVLPLAQQGGVVRRQLREVRARTLPPCAKSATRVSPNDDDDDERRVGSRGELRDCLTACWYTAERHLAELCHSESISPSRRELHALIESATTVVSFQHHRKRQETCLRSARALMQ